MLLNIIDTALKQRMASGMLSTCPNYQLHAKKLSGHSVSFSAMLYPLQMKNSARSISLINPVATGNVGNRHISSLSLS